MPEPASEVERLSDILAQVAHGYFLNRQGNMQRLVRDDMLNIARRAVPDWQSRPRRQSGGDDA